MPSSRENRFPAVLSLKTQGLTHKSIADQLGVHPSTVADDLATLRGRDGHVEQGGMPVTSGEPVPTILRRVHPPFLGEDWTEPRIPEEAWKMTPRSPGLYKWFLNGPLPIGFAWPSTLAPINLGDLIYVGQATNLRTRAKHHRLGTAGSTFRRTLASLSGYAAHQVGKSAHPRLAQIDEIALTEWMTDNLLMSFQVLGSREELRDAEVRLRQSSRAPFNKDGLTPEQKYASSIGLSWSAQAL